MWGDPERAAHLESSDSLSTLLLQVSGPGHIAWNDPRWQELLHGYDVWVHLEPSVPLAAAALSSMSRHASTSSNLAALCLHVARMVHDLHQATVAPVESENGDDDDENETGVMDFTQKIALVGKARATAGALNLVRLFVHDAIVQNAQMGDDVLMEVFLYQSRDVTERHRVDRQAGYELLQTIVTFLSNLTSSEDNDAFPPWKIVPELYDATVLSLELILVLLSTQLYQPMVSSSQRQLSPRHGHSTGWGGNVLLDHLMQEAKRTQAQERQRQREMQDQSLYEYAVQQSQQDLAPPPWTPLSLLRILLSWQMRRPKAPQRSIAFHFAELAQSVVQAKGEKVGPDGMYETHLVVMAERPSDSSSGVAVDAGATSLTGGDEPRPLTSRRSSRAILDATRGVLVLSSSLLLLPFRLVSLALGLWGSHSKQRGSDYDQSRKTHMQAHSRRTNDVLWLSNSQVADLGSTLFLLLTHNYRATAESNREVGNPFRAELAALNDSRWEAGTMTDPLASGVHEENGDFDSFVNEEETAVLSTPLLANASKGPARQLLATNFESLFQSFGKILHTEMGALMLYTLLQASPIFGTFLSVRSDLDTLVLPILRTLYFSSSARHISPHGLSRAGSHQSLVSVPSQRSLNADSSVLSIRSCPFRSQSQLYVILILLLLFSQDASFGPDAFRRVVVASVPWYKERNLKDISLGSLLLLTLLRSITFNLNKLQDAFLLSNCCAVLMNLSPNIVDLHDYAAMRVASVALSCMKRYSNLVAKNGGKVETEEDMTSVLGMYGEVSRTFSRLLRYCVSLKNIERNLHLVYALVYHQADFHSIVSKKPCPFPKSEMTQLQAVITTAATIVQEHGEARTAPKAMSVLKQSTDRLQKAVTSSDKKQREDFTFTYEEEADPEIFFLPYVWEVIVCVVTAGTMDWDTERIQVFALLDEVEEEDERAAAPTAGFAQDVSDVV